MSFMLYAFIYHLTYDKAIWWCVSGILGLAGFPGCDPSRDGKYEYKNNLANPWRMCWTSWNHQITSHQRHTHISYLNVNWYVLFWLATLIVTLYVWNGAGVPAVWFRSVLGCYGVFTKFFGFLDLLCFLGSFPRCIYISFSTCQRRLSLWPKCPA